MRAITTESVSKRLGGKLILSNVSLSVRDGEVVGITGPVGAGKSSLLFIMTGLMDPDRGSVSVFGQPLSTERLSVLERINYASSFHRLSGYASVRENLMTYARLYSVPDAMTVITKLWNEFSLSPSLMLKKTYRLSSGENSYVNLIKALLNDPDILFLDEITAHMDPQSALTVHTHLLARKKRGKTTIVVSQNHRELQSLCTRLIVLAKGKVLYEGAMPHLSKIKTYYAP